MRQDRTGQSLRGPMGNWYGTVTYRLDFSCSAESLGKFFCGSFSHRTYKQINTVVKDPMGPILIKFVLGGSVADESWLGKKFPHPIRKCLHALRPTRRVMPRAPACRVYLGSLGQP